MKNLLFLSVLLFAAFTANSQRLGKWILPDGKTIERINDSTQVERYMRWKDTLRIKWLNKKTYLIECPQDEWLRVKVSRVTAKGYKAMITDGWRRKYFYAKSI